MSKDKKQKNGLLRIVLLILFALALDALFFRNIITNDNLIGSNGDARYIDLILEHYYRWLQGKEKFTDLSCFYPVTNTISYSDMLIALAVPFCILRAMGASMFMANKWGLIGLHLLGTLSSVYFFDRKMKLNTTATVIGTIIFCYANSLSVKSWHNQMLAVCLYPLMFILLWDFFANIGGLRRKRIPAGLGAIAVLALVFYTSFYNAYFMLIYALFTIVAYCIALKRRKAKVWTPIWQFIRKNPLELILYVVFGIGIMTPFIMIYLPTLLTSGGWDWDPVHSMLPTWRDFFNVGPFNIVYGAFMEGPFFRIEGFYAGELRTGFPLITLTLFVIAAIWLRSKTPEKLPKRPRSSDYTDLLFCAAAAAVFCCFAIMIKVHGHSFWYFIYKYLPGASGIRAVSRFNMFLTLPVGIVTAVFVDRFEPALKMNRNKKLALIVALPLWLVAENTLTCGTRSLWTVHEAVELTNTVAAPPSDCDVMFIVDSGEERAFDNDKDYQLAAWEVAYKYNIPCINGHSGQFPQGWHHMSPFHGNENYMKAMSEWIEKYQIKNVYAYDIADNSWKKYSE